MDTFDQQKNECWLFNHSAYRLRTKNRLDNEILNGSGILLEGLYTKQHKKGKFNGSDIFGGSMVTLAVDGQFINGIFYKMGDVKTYFYSNKDYVPTMLSLMQVGFAKDEDISVLKSLGDAIESKEKYTSRYLLYAFCVNTVLPDLDMMAAKLVSL